MLVHKTTFFILVHLSVLCMGNVFRSDYTYYPEASGWFKLHRVPVDWHTARLQCYAEGAVLASPLNEDILKVMKDIIGESKPGTIHTGVHATFSNGVYTSVEGVPLDDLAIEWGANEPNNNGGKQECMAFFNDGMGDFSCLSNFPYICYSNFSVSDQLTECGTADKAYTLNKELGQCYKFHNQAQTWPRAMRICEAEGGHLAIINSQEEMMFLKELFAEHPKLLYTDHVNSVSLGFRKWGNTNSWWTIHGQGLEEAGYAQWSDGEPNGALRSGMVGRQACGTMFRSGKLDDNWCDANIAFICEKSP